ncbi:FAD-dependent oxidoreductase [Nonomuraea sp. NPDC046570]
MDLVILGAGPAGLAAAWRAARLGLSVTVLERASAVGGLSVSAAVAAAS